MCSIFRVPRPSYTRMTWWHVMAESASVDNKWMFTTIIVLNERASKCCWILWLMLKLISLEAFRSSFFSIRFLYRSSISSPSQSATVVISRRRWTSHICEMRLKFVDLTPAHQLGETWKRCWQVEWYAMIEAIKFEPEIVSTTLGWGIENHE